MYFLLQAVLNYQNLIGRVLFHTHMAFHMLSLETCVPKSRRVGKKGRIEL